MISSTLVLALLLSQPVSDPTVPVILRERVVIIKRSEAEAWLRTTKDARLRAAIEIALGTMPVNEVDREPSELTPQDRERFRWQRRALQ